MLLTKAFVNKLKDTFLFYVGQSFTIMLKKNSFGAHYLQQKTRGIMMQLLSGGSNSLGRFCFCFPKTFTLQLLYPREEHLREWHFYVDISIGQLLLIDRECILFQILKENHKKTKWQDKETRIDLTIGAMFHIVSWRQQQLFESSQTQTMRRRTYWNLLATDNTSRQAETNTTPGLGVFDWW